MESASKTSYVYRPRGIPLGFETGTAILQDRSTSQLNDRLVRSCKTDTTEFCVCACVFFFLLYYCFYGLFV